jgi:hypothetical protein
MIEPNIEGTGRCLCGAIRCRAEGEPEWAAFCQDESCRRATGAPTTAYAGFLRERFCYLEGEPERFSSSPGVVRSFRGRCGTPLTHEGDRWPGEVHVLVGTLDHPERVTPQGHAFEERLPWLHLADAAEA